MSIAAFVPLIFASTPINMAQSDRYGYLLGMDASALQDLYELFQANPEQVAPDWRLFFEGFDLGVHHDSGRPEQAGTSPATEPSATQASVSATGNGLGLSTTPSSGGASGRDEFAVAALIQAYRSRGHLISKTNPIRERKYRDPGVDLSAHGLNESHLEQRFQAGQLLGLGATTLKHIIDQLQSIYCRSMGFEFAHIRETEIRQWCQDYFETHAYHYDYQPEKKKRILSKLNEAVVFENFLHKKFVGQKRFSLEGGENTIPALDAAINRAAQLGVESVVIGMAHRGRLNVLANILGKTYEYIFNEFEGIAQPDLSFGDGDVKYHLGFSGQTTTPDGQKVTLDLVPNPSHLEAVDPVLEGFVRARCEMLYDKDYSRIMPIVIHGDAALAGQGVVSEVAQMSQLKGYHTGGSIHFVINNQIGFTTDFDDARSSDYCTAIANAIGVPVVHVNGDDAEAVTFAIEFAVNFRQQFKRDVFIDMVCYRRHGHNESDEPKFTQPTLYSAIERHPDPRQIYSAELVRRGDINGQLAADMEENFKALLQDRLNLVKQKSVPYKPHSLDKQWEQMRRSTYEDFNSSPPTGIGADAIRTLVDRLTTAPEGFRVMRKVQRVLDERRQLHDSGQVNWALAELLAYGSLLLEGKSVRISGQDVIRGTFSHRHAGLRDEETNELFIPLQHLNPNQGAFNLYNSLLSEYAVLGFEYGYSLASPHSLTLWEAQFGDFANGAQTVIDQFLSSGESKWRRMSGLVMLLPHGYEGQGPEHSNARPERFLQLAAEMNMVVANCTHPANFFHLLRRQLAWGFRKPLVVMSPKALLRHPLCISPMSELTEGGFREIIDDPQADTRKVKRVLMCTGKIYYDLLARQQEEKRKDVAIVRIEQLYPMSEPQLDAIYARYPKAEFVWVQEEPKNMGAWTYMLRFDQNRHLRLIGRKSSASPATGYARVHEQEQAHILQQAFTL
jgi:2-oxoglutarate dehydrogenase E1 component